jgi:uncharacterized protein
MLPDFPNFKLLGREDKPFIEAMTSKFLPYSDFNFTSLWSWDINSQIRVANLNGNMVIRFSDYLTAEPFYSFLGTNDCENTAITLIKQSTADGLKPILKMVPESTAKLIRSAPMVVSEDRDQFDYLYSVEKLQYYRGTKLSAKRNYVRRFIRQYQVVVKNLDLVDVSTQNQVKDVFDRWASEKGVSESEVSHERAAFARFLALGEFSQIVAIGADIASRLVGFWIFEIVNNQFAISHFSKAEARTYVGIYPYLLQKGAWALATRDIRFINYEQDLGIPGLRMAKMDYSPDDFLRKFSINISPVVV